MRSCYKIDYTLTKLNTKKAKECATEQSSGELAVKAAMDENGNFALTVARLALLMRRGGRGEDGATTG